MTGKKPASMVMVLAFLAIAGVALSVPSAMALEESQAGLTAGGIYPDANSTLDGQLRVAQLHGKGEAISVGLSMTAGKLHLEVDEQYNNGTVLVSVNPDERTIIRDYTDAHFAGNSDNSAAKLFFAALEGHTDPFLQLNGDGGHVTASEQQDVQQFQYEDREGRTISTEGAVAWKPPSGGFQHEIVMVGDIYFSNFEVPFTVTGEGDSDYTFSGNYEEKPVDGGPPLREEYRVAHIFAEDARLVLTISSPELVNKIFLRVDSIASPVKTTIESLTGTYRLGGKMFTASNDTVQIEEPIRLKDLRPVGDSSIAFELESSNGKQEPPLGEGTPSSPIEEGVREQQDPATVITEPSSAIPWTLVFPIGLAILGVTGTTTGVAIAKRPPFWLLGLALNRQNYAYVNRHTARFFEKEEYAGQASLLHTVALLGRSRHDEAAEFLTALPQGSRPERPTWDYLMGTVRALQGHHLQALVHIRDCLDSAPQYMEEVVGNPVFAPILDDLAQQASRESDVDSIGFT